MFMTMSSVSSHSCFKSLWDVKWFDGRDSKRGCLIEAHATILSRKPWNRWLLSMMSLSMRNCIWKCNFLVWIVDSSWDKISANEVHDLLFSCPGTGLLKLITIPSLKLSYCPKCKCFSTKNPEHFGHHNDLWFDDPVSDSYRSVCCLFSFVVKRVTKTWKVQVMSMSNHYPRLDDVLSIGTKERLLKWHAKGESLDSSQERRHGTHCLEWEAFSCPEWVYATCIRESCSCPFSFCKLRCRERRVVVSRITMRITPRNDILPPALSCILHSCSLFSRRTHTNDNNTLHTLHAKHKKCLNDDNQEEQRMHDISNSWSNVDRWYRVCRLSHSCLLHWIYNMWHDSLILAPNSALKPNENTWQFCRAWQSKASDHNFHLLQNTHFSRHLLIVKGFVNNNDDIIRNTWVVALLSANSCLNFQVEKALQNEFLKETLKTRLRLCNRNKDWFCQTIVLESSWKRGINGNETERRLRLKIGWNRREGMRARKTSSWSRTRTVSWSLFWVVVRTWRRFSWREEGSHSQCRETWYVLVLSLPLIGRGVQGLDERAWRERIRERMEGARVSRISFESQRMFSRLQSSVLVEKSLTRSVRSSLFRLL